MPVQKIEISAKTIVFTVLFLLVLALLWMIRDLLFSLLIAFIIKSALRPAVKKLDDFHIPHSLSVIGVYFGFLFMFGVLFSIILPPIFVELGSLIRNLPMISRNLSTRLGVWVDVQSLTQYLPDVTNQIVHLITSVFSNIIFLISTLFFGLYFLLEENGIRAFFSRYTHEPVITQVTVILDRAEKRLASWFWGEITLMMVVGLMTGIGLSLIGMKYVLALAVLAGLLEVVPTIGPLVAAVPAFLIGFSHSYFMGLSSIAVAVIVQQLENNLLVPVVMRRAVGMSPIVTLIALIIGGRIAGLLGILLAIPSFLVIESLFFELLNRTKVAEKLR